MERREDFIEILETLEQVKRGLIRMIETTMDDHAFGIEQHLQGASMPTSKDYAKLCILRRGNGAGKYVFWGRHAGFIKNESGTKHWKSEYIPKDLRDGYNVKKLVRRARVWERPIVASTELRLQPLRRCLRTVTEAHRALDAMSYFPESTAAMVDEVLSSLSIGDTEGQSQEAHDLDAMPSGADADSDDEDCASAQTL